LTSATSLTPAVWDRRRRPVRTHPAWRRATTHRHRRRSCQRPWPFLRAGKASRPSRRLTTTHRHRPDSKRTVTEPRCSARRPFLTTTHRHRPFLATFDVRTSVSLRSGAVWTPVPSMRTVRTSFGPVARLVASSRDTCYGHQVDLAWDRVPRRSLAPRTTSTDRRRRVSAARRAKLRATSARPPDGARAKFRPDRAARSRVTGTVVPGPPSKSLDFGRSPTRRRATRPDCSTKLHPHLARTPTRRLAEFRDASSIGCRAIASPVRRWRTSEKRPSPALQRTVTARPRRSTRGAETTSQSINQVLLSFYPGAAQ
jgi:hypothetical protein